MSSKQYCGALLVPSLGIMRKTRLYYHQQMTRMVEGYEILVHSNFIKEIYKNFVVVTPGELGDTTTFRESISLQTTS